MTERDSVAETAHISNIPHTTDGVQNHIHKMNHTLSQTFRESLNIVIL
jgi:hypothetical protein